MGVQALALLAVLDADCARVDRLGEATAEAFPKHPDYEIITCFPGLADISGARRARRNRRRPNPIRRRPSAESLRRLGAGHPRIRAQPAPSPTGRIKNNRLAAVGYTWAFMAVTTRQPARDHYRAAATTVTVTPPHSGTSSTGCSANCTTACRPAKPTTRSRPTDHHQRHRTSRRLTVNKIGGLPKHQRTFTATST